jgi:lysozyme
MSKLRESITRHEALRLKPYLDTSGKLTIGYGRNLHDVGIDKSEAQYMLDKDIHRATDEAQSYHWFWGLTEPRQDVVIEMIFNLGGSRFREFPKLIHALEKSDFETAAEEMIDSKWAREVGFRATELAGVMVTGQYAR